MTKTQACPVCNNSEENLTLERRQSVPTLQNITLASHLEAMSYPTGLLEMKRCSRCEFVWNAEFDEAIISYDVEYNNDVSQSDYYTRHLHAMADRILTSIPLGEQLHYVEVGCGEGDFINLLAEKAGSRCGSITGFDPSFSNDGGIPSNAIIHKCFFTPDQIDLISADANVICSRHTIEHVKDVQAFASALSAPITHENIQLFVETPTANWILENAAFQDFFYEHCSLFTPKSISTLFALSGLNTETVSVYGGQYMWSEISKSNEMSDGRVSESDNLGENYIRQYHDLISNWSDEIAKHKRSGPVAIWGAASKGVTFSLLFAGTDVTKIDCAIDLNPAKQNRYLPVTGLNVVSPEEGKQRGVSMVIIMNPNYESEIREMIGKMDWAPEIAVLNS